MSYGLEIRNSSNNIIIDENHTVPLVLSTGIAAAGSIGGWAAEGQSQLSVLDDGNLLWGKPYYATPPTTGTDYISVDYSFITIPPPVNSTIELRTWADGTYGSLPATAYADNVAWVRENSTNEETPTTTGYGMEIYDGNGNVVFTSNTGSFMEVVASGVSTDTTSFVFTAPQGESIYDYYVLANTFYDWTTTYQINGSSVTSALFNRALYNYQANTITVSSATRGQTVSQLIGKLIS